MVSKSRLFFAITIFWNISMALKLACHTFLSDVLEWAGPFDVLDGSSEHIRSLLALGQVPCIAHIVLSYYQPSDTFYK